LNKEANATDEDNELSDEEVPPDQVPMIDNNEITDPYLASAIEFMYSEDTEEDFNTMDREKQEALLKKTWMEREKQFYGEEIEDLNPPKNITFSIKEKPENEEEDYEDNDDSDSGDDLDRGAGNYTIKNLEQAISADDDEEETTRTDEIAGS
jgi:hypothetical protein